MSDGPGRLGTQACKPVLGAPATVLAGYRALHIQEAKYTGIALEEMPEGIAVWHRYLTMLERMLRGEHDSPSEDVDDARVAWTLRLALACGAAGTAKLALDATLAGYYSQAHALIRHILESWLQMVYVRLNNRAAWQWFRHEGSAAPREPSQNTIVNGIKKRGRHDAMLRNNLPIVEETLRTLNKGAHPSGLIVDQLESGTPGFHQLAANINSDLLRYTLSHGTVAIAMILHEMTESIPADKDWWAEFNEIRLERTHWHEASPREGPASSGNDTPTA